MRAANMVSLADEHWTLTDDGRALSPTAPGEQETLAAYAEYTRRATFTAWAGLADVIRGGDPPGYPVDDTSDRQISAATEALGLVDSVLSEVPFPPGARVADIGGGIGATAEALVGRRPDISYAIVELPQTAERARARLHNVGLADRVEVIAFTGQQRLDPPADRCLIVRVIVTLDDAAATDLLAFARRSLKPTGSIAVVDLEADGAPAAAFGDLFNLARSGGAVRTPEAWVELGRRAGLGLAARRPLAGPFVHLTFEPDSR